METVRPYLSVMLAQASIQRGACTDVESVALAPQWMLACASMTGLFGAKGCPKTNGCRD
jgi:hypothetical protein